jgi:superfamily II DNA/RNA helicase
VENLLTRQDRKSKLYKVFPYHNAMTPESRNRNLSLFSKGSSHLGTDTKNDESDDSNNNDNARTTGRSSSSRSRDISSSRSGGGGGGDGGGGDMSSSRRSKAATSAEADVDCILVCTDRAARGVDFEAAPVDHVVLFDFPKDPAEYVRRVGRVARAGRSGICTVLAFGWQLPIARSVMDKAGALDSAAMTRKQEDDDDDDDGNNERRGGARGRRQGQRKSFGDTNVLIKGNIEDGRLWGSDRQ